MYVSVSQLLHVIKPVDGEMVFRVIDVQKVFSWLLG